MCLHKVGKTHHMHVWNDLEWIQEFQVKNGKWELCSISEEREGAVCQGWL